MANMHVISRQIPKWTCPSCGALLDGITAAAGDREGTIPHEGCLSVCVYCAALLVIGDGHFECGTRQQLATLTEQEWRLIVGAIGRPIVIAEKRNP